jgi:hypothetical protein
MTYTFQRAYCPACNRLMPMYKNGKVYRHGAPTFEGSELTNGKCEGTGQYPATVIEFTQESLPGVVRAS